MRVPRARECALLCAPRGRVQASGHPLAARRTQAVTARRASDDSRNCRREGDTMFDSIKRRPRRHMVKAGIAAAAAAAAAGGVFFASTAGAAPLPTTARSAIASSSDDINSIRVNGRCLPFPGYATHRHYHYMYTNVWVSNSANVAPNVLMYGGNKCEGYSQIPTAYFFVKWDGPMRTVGGYRWVHISNRNDD